VLSTLKGIPVAYELVSAREANASPVVLRRSARMRCTDERKAVEGVLQLSRLICFSGVTYRKLESRLSDSP
ncbi:MAG: hypothetical protein AAF383_28555, partial [Cyanobacteria bacterium P01_A01_bin.83]